MPHWSMFAFNEEQRSGECHISVVVFADVAGDALDRACELCWWGAMPAGSCCRPPA